MEILLVALLLVALPVVFVSAKRGAEAARLERARRWGEVPGTRPGAEVTLRRSGAQERSAGGAVAAPHSTLPVTAGDPPRRRQGSGGDGSGSIASGPDAGAGESAGHSTGSGRPTLEASARRVAGSAAQNAAATARTMRSTASSALRRQPAPIDINRAPVSELQNLPGVGIRAAERIVAHRERHGDFDSVDDLVAVEGFDQHRVGRLTPRATV